MNEIELSTDLNQIELEIKHHKQIAGQSIWEIGRRLNHVKEKDLMHGEFGDWLSKVNINQSTANKMMKITRELPNSYTYTNLGLTALDLISSLPENERDKEHELSSGESKVVNEMTVRELKELKREIAAKDDALKGKDKIIDDLRNREPEIVEKIVEKEVQHPHVEDLRSDNKQLSEALRQAQVEADAAKKRNQFIEQQYNDLLEQRKEVNESSEKYEQLTEAIENAEGRLNSTQKLVSDYKQILKILRQGNEFLLTISGLTYMDITETVNESVVVSREFDSLVRSLERLVRDLSNIRKQNIIEGDFEDE